MGIAAQLLREARRRAGLSQRGLAAVARTSGATVAAYEAGTKDPRVETLQRLLQATGTGLRLADDGRGVEGPAPRPRPLTREERLDLAFHRAVLRRLLDDPEDVRARGRRNLEHLRRVHADGAAGAYLDRWAELLEGDLEDLVAALAGLDEDARALRQSTPFAGVVPPAERWAVIRRERERRRAS